jgi:O-antigen/teichoic acid export membrane protein
MSETIPLTQNEREEEQSLQPAQALALEGRVPNLEGGLRRYTARGTIINASFRVGLAGLTLVQRTAVAAFLTPSELGVWGAVLIAVMTVMFLKSTAIGDKYIQQSEDDQEIAFQKAFSFDVVVTLAFLLVTALLLPVFALAYGNTTIILPGLVLLVGGIGVSLQSPTWIFYRRMDFVRQRILEAVAPVVTFIGTIALAAAGMGYWALVIGFLVGSWCGALVALRASPYKIRPRFDPDTAREYFGFSWPLFIAGVGGIVIAQGSILAASHTVGLAGVGAITLAVSVTTFGEGVDAIVTETLYPAICAVQDRTALLYEVFVKSNRVALMWGMAFGLGVSLFAADLVHYVIGDEWEHAIILLQVFGVIVALDQLGFNWAAFLRARNETRPIAIVAATQTLSFLIFAIPLLIAGGLRGYAFGMLAMTVVTIGARGYFLARLFSGFQMLKHSLRAISPAVPPVLIVLGLRLVEPAGRTAGTAIVELVVYVAITVAATIFFERDLLREIVSYLRRKPAIAT